jgi:hypothetical protein
MEFNTSLGKFFATSMPWTTPAPRDVLQKSLVKWGKVL